MSSLIVAAHLASAWDDCRDAAVQQSLAEDKHVWCHSPVHQAVHDPVVRDESSDVLGSVSSVPPSPSSVPEHAGAIQPVDR
ncbi:hypothetical protein DIPPA_70038 [Diplonema papillatum]|nr:hypothetical protein DIPPA_70038 [Diplonema papillatum]